MLFTLSQAKNMRQCTYQITTRKSSRPPKSRSHFRVTMNSAACLLAASLLAAPATAQTLPVQWDTNLDVTPTQPPPETETPAPATPNTTVIQRSPTPPPGETPPAVTPSGQSSLQLSALLTQPGQKISNGLVWRVYQSNDENNKQPRLVATDKSSAPQFALKPGKYVVNVTFGRAYLTRTITIEPGTQKQETFVLNAGGLKLVANVDGNPAQAESVTYDILEGEPDQSGQRKIVIANAKPNLIIRLNSGIYRLISRYGDANARIHADVEVEAGKLTVATVAHTAATVTFKLVDRPGGEAHPGIQWSIATPKGEVVKKSVGALPTHILAPGTYIVTAVSKQGTYQAEFAIEGGQVASVEVVRN